MSKYIYWVKKRLVWGCFRIEEIRDKDNETGLKEGGGIEMSNYSAFHIRDAPLSLSLLYLLTFMQCVFDITEFTSRYTSKR